ncbi:MAG: glycosyltransferase family 39 protein [Chloroflexi bacterium]|nr:glycosyltransferase family 39 protein [Chloroflexota bacterium]
MVVIITTVGFFLRLYRLDTVPFRGDEAFTVQNWMSLPLSQSLTQIAAIEPHPFLTYALFRAWGLLAGTSEFAARLLPALVNVLGIPAVYVLGRKLLGWREGLLAAFFWAVHPYLIWHSQDARNYAIWVSLSTLAVWAGLRALERKRLADYIVYGLAALLTISIFYLDLFTLAAMLVYVVLVYRHKLQKQSYFVFTTALVLLISLVSFLLLQGSLLMTGSYGGTTGGGLDVSRLLTEFVPVLAWGTTLPVELRSISWILLCGILLFGMFIVWQKYRQTAVFLGLLTFLPLLFLSLVSLCLNVFAPRYVLSVTPFLILLLASVVVNVRSYLFRLGIFCLWALVTLFSLYGYFFVDDYAKSKSWPDLSSYLEARASPNDLVIQLSADAAFGYYYRAPADETALPASPSQPPSDIIAALEANTARYHSIWLVGQTFPDWPNAGVVENWATNNLQLVRQTNVSGLAVQQYMPWIISTDEIASRQPLARFQDTIELLDAHVLLPAEPTNQLTVWVYWRPLNLTQAPYKVFVHLQGPFNLTTGNPIWSQDDRYPQNGRVSTTEWTLAAIYRDIYMLPLHNVPPGVYDVRIGLYEPVTGQRLKLTNGDDSYLIQTITLP